MGLPDVVAGIGPPGHAADERPGHPYSWRHMNGYGSHTFCWYNDGGQKFWVLP
ncbi:MAG TPA: catalase [Streptosporangiaceae bacterium]|nr:catalase [Streptosporangiaceae bacterium]